MSARRPRVLIIGGGPGGMAAGIFWHDLHRAFDGHTGKYSTMEWIVAGAASFSAFRVAQGRVPLRVSIDTSRGGRGMTASFIVENCSLDAIEGVDLEILCSEGIVPADESRFFIEKIQAGEKKRVDVPLAFTRPGEPPQS